MTPDKKPTSLSDCDRLLELALEYARTRGISIHNALLVFQVTKFDLDAHDAAITKVSLPEFV